MKVSVTYHRPQPDTVTGHKLVLKQEFYSDNEIEIDLLENAFKQQYGSGVIAECDLNFDPQGGVDLEY